MEMMVISLLTRVFVEFVSYKLIDHDGIFTNGPPLPFPMV